MTTPSACPSVGYPDTFAFTVANACVTSNTRVSVQVSGSNSGDTASPDPGHFTPALMTLARHDTVRVSVTVLPQPSKTAVIPVPCIGSALFTHIEPLSTASGQVWVAVVCTATVLSVAVYDSAANAHAWAGRAIFEAAAPAVPNLKLSGSLHGKAETAAIVGGVVAGVVGIGLLLLGVLYKGPGKRSGSHPHRHASNALPPRQ